MKTSNLSNLPTFTPGGAGSGTLNFSTAVTNNGFAFGRLFAVMNLTQNVLIYAATATGLGGTWNSGTSVLTLAASTTGHNAADVLEVIWDDPKCTVVLDAPNAGTPVGWPSTFKLVSAASSNATVVKATAGTLGSVITSASGTPVGTWVKIYDKSTAPIAGDTPKFTFYVAANATHAPTVYCPPGGVKFVNGIAIAMTSGSSDAALGATGADSAIVNLAYA